MDGKGNTSARHYFAAVILAVAALTANTVSFGQQNNDTLEEVLVTAQKRVANLQDVPFSVASSSEEQIRNSGSGNVVDLARNIAGLAVADLGPGQSQMA